eukprot:1729104-Rhodomonas_salina.2
MNNRPARCRAFAGRNVLDIEAFALQPSRDHDSVYPAVKCIRTSLQLADANERRKTSVYKWRRDVVCVQVSAEGIWCSVTVRVVCEQSFCKGTMGNLCFVQKKRPDLVRLSLEQASCQWLVSILAIPFFTASKREIV